MRYKEEGKKTRPIDRRADQSAAVTAVRRSVKAVGRSVDRQLRRPDARTLKKNET